MADPLENITQKPAVTTRKILPDDFVYIVRANADFHARGADLIATCASLQLDITTLNQLRAYPTAGIPRPHLIAVDIETSSRFWLVKDGTRTDDGNLIIRPDDYDAATNAVEIVSYL